MAFYVYEYRDPTRDNVPVYVGKGKGERAWAHLSPTSAIGNMIKRCRDAGQRIEPQIVAYFESEADAFKLEMELIARYGRADQGTGTLVNLTSGGGRVMQPNLWRKPALVQVYGKTRRRQRRSRRRKVL